MMNSVGPQELNESSQEIEEMSELQKENKQLKDKLVAM